MEKDGRMLSESIADQILSLTGPGHKYKPGAKLPNENILAESLGVSRSTLREAIRMLSAGGVLEIRRGLGTFVTVKASLNFEKFKRLNKSAKNIYEAFELRLMFEPKCAALAAERATKEELKKILVYGEELVDLIKEGKSTVDADKIFHESIASAAHNSYVEQLLPVVYDGIENSILLMEKNKSFFDQSLSDTRMIIDFLSKRNTEGAFTAMQMHILNAMEFLKTSKYD